MSEPIFNLDAEESVLGAMLMNDRAAERALETLQPKHFYRHSHGELFRCMGEMFIVGQSLDAVTVSGYVRENGAGMEAERIHELAALVPASQNVLHYAKLVKDTWTKRELASSIMALHGRLEEMPANEAVAAFEEESIRVAELVEEKHESIVDAADALAGIQRHLDNPADIKGIKTPFSFLDEMVGGRLYILGGYQGHGKTATGMQFVETACSDGMNVGIASLEMSKDDLMERWLAGLARVSYPAIKNGDLSPTQRARVDEALERMRPWKFTILDDEEMTTAKLSRIQRGRNFDILIVDHIHEMRFADRREIEKNVRDLKNLSRRHNIPVLALAQLTRSGDWKNPYPQPTAKLLRESGMIDALAAHIWFIYRERDEDGLGHRGRFIVDKNRFGPTFAQPLYFDSNIIGFSEQNPLEEELIEVVAGAGDGLPF